MAQKSGVMLDSHRPGVPDLRRAQRTIVRNSREAGHCRDSGAATYCIAGSDSWISNGEASYVDTSRDIIVINVSILNNDYINTVAHYC